MFIYVFVKIKKKLDILKTTGPSTIVKNHSIRAGAILSLYILQNIILTNYADSSNTHYYIPLHDCVIKRRSCLTYSLSSLCRKRSLHEYGVLRPNTERRNTKKACLSHNNICCS